MVLNIFLQFNFFRKVIDVTIDTDTDKPCLLYTSFEELVQLHLENGSVRLGRIVQIMGKRVVVQVFEGTDGLSLNNTTTEFTGHPMEIALSKEILGRIFNGAGKPIDGLGDIYADQYADINLSLIHI